MHGRDQQSGSSPEFCLAGLSVTFKKVRVKVVLMCADRPGFFWSPVVAQLCERHMQRELCPPDNQTIQIFSWWMGGWCGSVGLDFPCVTSALHYKQLCRSMW